MIHQIDMNGKDMVETAIERIQSFADLFDSDESYFVAFSGGKDSVVIKKLCEMAGVKFEAHYSVTTVDPPELTKFILNYHPDVVWDKHYYDKDGIFVNKGQQISMLNLIPEKLMPPTRMVRYCCQCLKETSGDGRLTITGVRKAESVNRKNNQGIVTIYNASKQEKEDMIDTGFFRSTDKGGVVLTNDNEESRDIIEYCYQRRKTVLNPIIDWDDSEVWEFIREYKVPYCELYDCGYKRLGCIGCPMSTHQKEELERYPAIKKIYLMAFEKMLKAREIKECETQWKTADEVMEWWISR